MHIQGSQAFAQGLKPRPLNALRHYNISAVLNDSLSNWALNTCTLARNYIYSLLVPCKIKYGQKTFVTKQYLSLSPGMRSGLRIRLKKKIIKNKRKKKKIYAAVEHLVCPPSCRPRLSRTWRQGHGGGTHYPAPRTTRVASLAAAPPRSDSCPGPGK